MSATVSQQDLSNRMRFLDQLKRSIKKLHADSDRSLTLTQYQNQVANALGYSAWNMLAGHVQVCGNDRFWSLSALCESRGLVAPEEDDDFLFDEFWYEGAGDS